MNADRASRSITRSGNAVPPKLAQQGAEIVAEVLDSIRGGR